MTTKKQRFENDDKPASQKLIRNLIDEDVFSPKHLPEPPKDWRKEAVWSALNEEEIELLKKYPRLKYVLPTNSYWGCGFLGHLSMDIVDDTTPLSPDEQVLVDKYPSLFPTLLGVRASSPARVAVAAKQKELDAARKIFQANQKKKAREHELYNAEITLGDFKQGWPDLFSRGIRYDGAKAWCNDTREVPKD